MIIQRPDCKYLVINICLCFFAYKNHNVGIAVAVVPIVGGFLSNIFLVIFIFSIANTGVKAADVLG